MSKGGVICSNTLSLKASMSVSKAFLKSEIRLWRDGHIHLVAAPGSGGKRRGIEFIRWPGKPALILVPTVTIRQQWWTVFVRRFWMMRV